MAGVVAAKLKLKKQQEAEEEAKVNDLDPHTFAQLKHNCTQDNIENNNEQVRDAIETVSENFQVVTLTLSQYHTPQILNMQIILVLDICFYSVIIPHLSIYLLIKLTSTLRTICPLTSSQPHII